MTRTLTATEPANFRFKPILNTRQASIFDTVSSARSQATARSTARSYPRAATISHFPSRLSQCVGPHLTPFGLFAVGGAVEPVFRAIGDGDVVAEEPDFHLAEMAVARVVLAVGRDGLLLAAAPAGRGGPLKVIRNEKLPGPVARCRTNSTTSPRRPIIYLTMSSSRRTPTRTSRRAGEGEPGQRPPRHRTETEAVGFVSWRWRRTTLLIRVGASKRHTKARGQRVGAETKEPRSEVRSAHSQYSTVRSGWNRLLT